MRIIKTTRLSDPDGDRVFNLRTKCGLKIIAGLPPRTNNDAGRSGSALDEE
jgi:hypothetical protein